MASITDFLHQPHVRRAQSAVAKAPAKQKESLGIVGQVAATVVSGILAFCIAAAGIWIGFGETTVKASALGIAFGIELITDPPHAIDHMATTP